MSVQIYCKHFYKAKKKYFVTLLFGCSPALNRKDRTGCVFLKKMVQALYDPGLKNRSLIMVVILSQKKHLVRIFKIPGNTMCYMGQKGMLLVGHGSTMPYNKELVEKTASLIKAQNTDFIVKCGFMNMNTPTIKDSLNEFRREPIDALVVVPLFLAKGVHIEKDIPGEIGLAEGTKKGLFTLNGRSVPLVYADPIGSDPLLADLMIKNATKALTLL